MLLPPLFAVAVSQSASCAAQVSFSPTEKPKTLLNFMMVLAGEGHGLTAVEIITSDQSATNLHQQLLAFEGICERVAGSRVGKPRRLTTDCGQNILLAMCKWLNGEDVHTVSGGIGHASPRHDQALCCGVLQFLTRRWSELWAEQPNATGKTLLCWCIGHVHRAAVQHVKSPAVFRFVAFVCISAHAPTTVPHVSPSLQLRPKQAAVFHFANLPHV